MSLDPSNVNNLPKMPKNVAPKNPNKPSIMPQPQNTIGDELRNKKGQTDFKADIKPQGEVTVEDKKSQQAHANANKAALAAVAMMKSAAAGATAGLAEYTGKTADGVEYSGSTDYSGTVTGTAGYTGKTVDGVEYSGTVEYSVGEQKKPE